MKDLACKYIWLYFVLPDTIHFMRFYEQSGPWAEMLGTCGPHIFMPDPYVLPPQNILDEVQ